MNATSKTDLLARLQRDTDLRELVDAIHKKYGHNNDEFLERALWCVAELGATIGSCDAFESVARGLKT